jgi:hypothetical protein
VLGLLLFLVLLALVLAALLWGGSMFAQQYLYTTPASGLIWRGAAAAGAVALFLFFWTLLNYAGGDPATGDMPFPVAWEFSNRVFLVDKPVPQFESKKRNGEPTRYALDKTQSGVKYKQVGGTEYWGPEGVEWIKLNHDNVEYKFERERSAETGSGGYRVFVDQSAGWEMDERWIGQPSHTSTFRLLVYFLLNLLHLVLWIVCCWLLLRFALPHAIVLGFVLWLIFTLPVFYVLFSTVKSALRA